DNGTVLRVATKAESIWSVFGKALPVIALIILAIIALCIALSRMLTRQLISPIERMGERLDDPSVETPYSELQPFLLTIRKQHTDILSAAKARQDFTANVSHELKTPLTAISGYAELLESGMVQDEQKSHFYREIRRNAARLLTLINDTIRLSELDRSERNPAFEELDLNEVVLECIEGLKISAAQRNIEVSYEGESCRIRGSRDMLRELAENLIQNAVRYNNPGGHVNVRVGRSEGGSARLVVNDDGIGIPASEQERIFERFYRVDKSRSKDTGGTGLGLAIVKHIVELHDARISLDSTPAVGTTVEVDFR
ncbi:MAG: ATP-binding protein, partial [Firmicutes bacterium]|nr:ATP-binding protein [Bacillota bacterium]